MYLSCLIRQFIKLYQVITSQLYVLWAVIFLEFARELDIFSFIMYVTLYIVLIVLQIIWYSSLLCSISSLAVVPISKLIARFIS